MVLVCGAGMHPEDGEVLVTPIPAQNWPYWREMSLHRVTFATIASFFAACWLGPSSSYSPQHWEHAAVPRDASVHFFPGP